MEKKPEKSRSSRTVSRITFAVSCAFASAADRNAGRAIGIFGRAAPTMRMIGTEGIGASGGGAWASCPAAAGTATAKASVKQVDTYHRERLKGTPERDSIGGQAHLD